MSEARRLRFGREAEMPLEHKTLKSLSSPTKRSKAKSEPVRLTASESRRLIGICIELIDICSKVTGKIDPAVGTVIAFARDEALAEALEISS
jgi:hypothetical protein